MLKNMLTEIQEGMNWIINSF